MIVLGIDPGTIKAGYGVVDFSSGAMRFEAAGTLPLGEKDPIEIRLAALRDEAQALVDDFDPGVIVLERAFVKGGPKGNPQSALRLGEARGVVLAIAGGAGLQVQHVATPSLRSTLFCGPSSTKEDIARAVCKILDVNLTLDQPDATDGLALALCWDGSTGRVPTEAP